MRTTAARQIVEYPRVRPSGLPPSPLSFVESGFARLFRSPERVEKYRALFAASVRRTTEYAEVLVIGDFNHREPYNKQKAVFLRNIAGLVGSGDYSARSWRRQVKTESPLHYAGVFADEIEEVSKADRIEQEFIGRLIRYLIHDKTHTSPGAIVTYGLGELDLRELVIQNRDLPEQVRPHFAAFQAGLEPYFRYCECLDGMGEAFFTPLTDLPALPQLRGTELTGFIEMMGHAFALRFLSSYFKVTTEPVEQPVKQHTLAISVDPALAGLTLPLYLLGPKIVGDIKNCLRVVWARENEADDTALARVLSGREVASPVLVQISAQRLNAKVWELRVSDNGRGIIVEELFRPLVRAVKLFPDAIAPALKLAVERWEQGDPFAFNNIPLGDLLESVFQLGVSSGTGSAGSGIGLWGSMMLLLKLGARIKVGVTPQTGGFYESIILPLDLSVSPQEVAWAERLAWR